MSELNFMLLPITEENLEKVEFLRYDAYGVAVSNIDRNSYYLKEIRKGNILVFACILNKNIVAACYVSNSFHSLYIEQLFVKKEFQETGLRIGRKLLVYVHQNKSQIEQYFHQQFSFSTLEYISSKAKALYEKVGYKETSVVLGKMKKTL